jgi:hypothetical protein
MGGKRPDQHNIDPREARTTDNKFLTEDEHVKEESKHALNAHDRDDQPMIPPAGTNPALRELRARRGEGETNEDQPETD